MLNGSVHLGFWGGNNLSAEGLRMTRWEKASQEVGIMKVKRPGPAGCIQQRGHLAAVLCRDLLSSTETRAKEDGCKLQGALGAP